MIMFMKTPICEVDHRQSELPAELLRHFDVVKQGLILHQCHALLQDRIDVADGLIGLPWRESSRPG
jgi:hypothetical protein